MNTKEKEFLAIINRILDKYDDLEKELDNAKQFVDLFPQQQSQVDMKLSDYLHILEDEELTDEQFIKIGRNIKDARKERRGYQKTSVLIQTFNRHMNKIGIVPKTTRDMFRNELMKEYSHLNEKYKFRVLSDNDIEQITKTEKKKISKEELQKQLNEGKSQTAIAKEYGVSQPYINILKKKWGL